MADTTPKFYRVTNQSSEFATVREYCADYNSPAFHYYEKETSFLDIKDEGGVTNRQRLFDSYSTYEAETLFVNYADKDLPMRIGVSFVVPVEKVDRGSLLTQGLEVVSVNDVAFKSAALSAIEADAGYVRKEQPIAGKASNGITITSNPEVSIWIWCRSLSPDNNVVNTDGNGGNPSSEMKGAIFDVTPFISSINTSVSANGGNFSITLPPLICELNGDGVWTIKKNSLMQYVNPKNLSQSQQGYIAEASIFDENMKRNQFLFHNIIGSNDLVFIRFEPLQIEKDRIGGIEDFNVDKNRIPGKIYDMIGLVDVDGSSVIPSTNDGSITINGRDLVKLFIDDGSYFYTFEQVEGGQIMSQNNGVASKYGLLERVFSENASTFYNLWFNNSVEHVFEFVINQLSNIGIVPDDLFSGYDNISNGTKRNTVMTTGDLYKNKPRNQVLQEYKDNAIEAIKKLRKLNKVSDADVNAENRKIVKLFDDVKDFLQAIRDKDVRVIGGQNNNETKGWNTFEWLNPDKVTEKLETNVMPSYFNHKLYEKSNLLTNGDVPHSDVLRDVFENTDYYIDVDKSQGKYREVFSEELARGIWQIVKLVIDKSVAERRLNDSSISAANGSLLNFFRKVVQAPFAEILFDTYYDTYTLTIRKPPTDQIALISLIEGKVNTEDGRVVEGLPAIIDVEAEDVLKEDLYFDDQEIYSWYHLTPEANYIGSDTFNYAYLPALYFPEYADIWGSRPMDISHKYMPYIPLDPKNPKTDMNITQEQAIHDLKYMIDSNMMNPFLHRGTLMLNGDRRLKVGNLLRYKPTGEIFRIDGVQNHFKIGENTIDRTTTVMVSRGMVEQLIYGIPYKNSRNQEVDHISYYNIINTNLNLKYTTTDEIVEKQVEDGFETITTGGTIMANGFQDPFAAQHIASASFTTTSQGVIKNQGLNKLALLGKEQREVFTQFINAINQQGIMVIVNDTIRTKEEQQVLYGKNNLKVRNAPPGHSKHEAVNGGLAMDISLLIKEGGNKYSYTKRVDSKSNYSNWIATGVPTIAKNMGLLWGGEAFNSYYDPVHFQIVPKQVTSEKKVKYKTVKNIEKKRGLDQQAIFSNFKVNQHVLDFFLKKNQFGSQYNTGQINRNLYKADVKRALGGI